ncbi:hypothetical protein DBR43_31710 [Pedobacter sp. KBW06]|uniref:hypothetical protein n=1 Tax=Pedobacter sp. KBW06 TaxID=2153359 RepID=UPI000F5AF792|nr:hypothetical protein [Pedobacter sp. KBW06]RQO64848.1 hypothetical protein DBR43_31710 [Pedobacter sp. KBW06]
MADNLVGYSRAGDMFHYQYAARRSLRLLDPNSAPTLFKIEGSPEPDKEGEYVIDLFEQYGDSKNAERILYFQLKHTTQNENVPFILSDLKDTFVGFAKRFKEHHSKNEIISKNIQFNIVTNRPFDHDLKSNLKKISTGKDSGKRFLNTLTKYTKLDPDELKQFCSILNILDTEGNYTIQEQQLRIELTQLFAGSINHIQIMTISNMMATKVMPNSDGTVTPEEVLHCFGMEMQHLYPATPVWEPAAKLIRRECHDQISKQILSYNQPVIVHAPGGVGKSVFTRQLVENIEEGSVAIAYDCFGAGKYRNKSHSRHRHRDALVQITNELAVKGLTEILLAQNGTQDSDIIRKFLHRIEMAILSIRKAYPEAVLLILVDAADNSEMAAEEMSENCFASDLLAEEMPDGCKLVYLCRTERILLLNPKSTVHQIPLDSFTLSETKEHLRQHFPDASEAESEEFHRLSLANPRVQANAIAEGAQTLEVLLSNLGPNPVTVEKQIELQLEKALNKVKDAYPKRFHKQFQKICTGLASLSPNIPLEILAKIAKVDVPTIFSFVTDFGRSLWITGEAVQFRDEPTETWFKKTFTADTTAFKKFAKTLEPLAEHSTYVAGVLPQIYHQAEQYRKLIDLSLSDDYLPKNNEIDARNIRIYRLHFALKAALRINELKDAAVLALRAGEEIAGNSRQFYLLRDNLHLITELRTADEVHEMALKRDFHSGWDGSSNLYSASLLSRIPEFRGEALAFQRSAINWLRVSYDTPKDPDDRDDVPSEADWLELLYLKLQFQGTESAATMMCKMKDRALVHKISGWLIQRLADFQDFETIHFLLAKCSEDPILVMKFNQELALCGLSCPKKLIRDAVKKIKSLKADSLAQPIAFDDYRWKGPVSLAETALGYGIAKEDITIFLNRNLHMPSSYMLNNSRYFNQMDHFMRSLALRHELGGGTELIEEFLSAEKPSKTKASYDEQRKYEEKKNVVLGLLPWYKARLGIVTNGGKLELNTIETFAKASKKSVAGLYLQDDPVPVTIAKVCLDILKFASGTSVQELKEFYHKYVKGNKSLYPSDWNSAVYFAHRAPHLAELRDEIEDAAFRRISHMHDIGPDELSELYMSLTRAVLKTSKDNALFYFGKAAEAVSKVGDELFHRWDAVVPLAKQTATSKKDEQQLAQRFMRTAEGIGKDQREKHWSRTTAVITAVQLSPGGGLSALSRWRDREIGDADWANAHALLEMVESWDVDPLAAWSFTTLSSRDSLARALERFVKSKLIPAAAKNQIITDAVSRMKREGIEINFWFELEGWLSEEKIKNPALAEILAEFPARQKKDKAKSDYQQNKDYQPDLDWEAIFRNLNLLDYRDIEKLNTRIEQHSREKKTSFQRYVIWNESLKRISTQQLAPFIDEVLKCDWLVSYDFEALLARIPESWALRPAFQQQLDAIIEKIGIRFALDLTEDYGYRNILKVLPKHENSEITLQKGIFNGLINSREFASAEQLFGLARLASPYLTPAQAAETLDYALSRFECHFEDSFADGPWQDWLETSADPIHVMSGYLWAALASPSADIRWRAAHTIRRLAAFGRTNVIGCLFQNAKENKARAFGAKDYPFYQLNANLFLVIACARVSLELPETLESFASELLFYATDSEHALIMKFASEAALALASKFPLCYTPEQIHSIDPISRSLGTLGEVELEEWHNTNLDQNQISAENQYQYEDQDETEVEENEEDFHLDYDFKKDWLSPLADSFGLKENYISQLISNIIHIEWELRLDKFDDDSRSDLWNKASNYNRLSSRHGYPEADDYRFYLSYHALMVVAARLLSSIPLLKAEEYDEYNPWEGFLSSHSLTRPDGRWISDWRDPAPLQLPEWASQDFQEWHSAIPEQSFINAIIGKREKEIIITLSGNWREEVDSKRETTYVASALVEPTTSDALLRALSTCENPRHFVLPAYKDSHEGIDRYPFRLWGWIVNSGLTAELDKRDPFANELPIPPIEIGEKFCAQLGLLKAVDHKSYALKNQPSKSIIQCQMWCASPASENDNSQQRGNTIRCKFSSLINILKELNMELLLEVEIERKYHTTYRSQKDDKDLPAVHKLFIISQNGTIRDIRQSYPIG